MTQENNHRRFRNVSSTDYPSVDFEGLWVNYWPIGQLRYRGVFEKKQVKVGQHISFWENGVLRQLSYWVDGCVTGTSLYFHETGIKECEIDYGASNPVSGSYIERLYNLGGRLSSVFVWKDDIIVSEWTRPDLLESWEKIGADQIIEEEIKKLYPDYSSEQ